MDVQFLDLIESYKKNVNKLEELRLYILSKLSDSEIVDYIKTLLDTSSEINYLPGVALSKAMHFWIYLGKNIEEAYQYNCEAKKIYESLPDYKKLDGYLTVLNNQLIYFNTRGDLKASYFTAKEALQIVNEEHKITYLVAFSTNYVAILNELGLYEKSYETLTKNDDLKEYLPPRTIIVRNRLKFNALINLKKYKAALQLSIETYEYNAEEKVFLDVIFLADQLLAYTLLDNKENAEACYKSVTKSLTENEKMDRDLLYIYRCLGKYMEYIGDLEKAKEYYEAVYAKLNNVLGYKRLTLLELSAIYEKLNDYSNAIKIKNEAIELQSFLLATIGEILNTSDLGVASSFSNIAYRDLYNRIDLINSFLKDISQELDICKIENALSVVLESIAPNNKHMLILNDAVAKKQIYVHDSIIEDFNKSIDYNLNKIEIIKDKNLGTLYIDDSIKSNIDLDDKIIRKLIDGLTNAVSGWMAYEHAFDSSIHDSLTLLLNRFGFARELDKLKDANVESYFAISIDIDDFKKVNDSYGHIIGDDVLRKVSNHIASIFGKNLCARTGGEEFSAVFIGTNEELEVLLSKLVKTIEADTFSYNGNDFNVTISAGAYQGFILDEYDSIYDLADKNMYFVKQNGKNNYRIGD